MPASIDLMLKLPLDEQDLINTTTNEGKEQFFEKDSVAPFVNMNNKDVETSAESEVARFNRERIERIRGLRLNQTIKAEEEARKAADAEAIGLWKEKQYRLAAARAHATQLEAKLVSRAGSTNELHQVDQGTTGREEKNNEEETSRIIQTIASSTHDGKEVSSSLSYPAFDSVAVEHAAAGGQIAHPDIVTTATMVEDKANFVEGSKLFDENVDKGAPARNTRASIASMVQNLVEGQEQHHHQQAAGATREVDHTSNLQEEEEEKCVVTQLEERKGEHEADESEIAILYKEEDDPMSTLAQTHAARPRSQLAATDKEKTEMMQKHEEELRRRKAMEQRIAAQTEAARLQKEEEDRTDSRSASRNQHRPLSASLRRHREYQEQKEDKLRDIMQGISESPKSANEVMSDSEDSFQTTNTNLTSESLVSHSRNLVKGQSLKWDKVLLHICFGLLTTAAEAPRNGLYQSYESIENASMLQSIMSKVKETSKEVLEQGTGNIIIKSLHPFVTSVERDDSFGQRNRPGVVRSFVKATIPLSLTDGQVKLTNTSKIVAKVTLRQALIEEVKNGKLTP